MWEGRCYLSGIPDGDEVPLLLQQGSRVPSWKKIALAILKNDHQLKSIGFSVEESKLVGQIKQMKRRDESNQCNLF